MNILYGICIPCMWMTVICIHAKILSLITVLPIVNWTSYSKLDFFCKFEFNNKEKFMHIEMNMLYL